MKLSPAKNIELQNLVNMPTFVCVCIEVIRSHRYFLLKQYDNICSEVRPLSEISRTKFLSFAKIERTLRIDNIL
jgi:hypothetical protein